MSNNTYYPVSLFTEQKPRQDTEESFLPSIFCYLSGSGSQGQQSKQRSSHFPFLSHLLHLFCGETESFTRQQRDINSPAGPRPRPSGTCLKNTSKGGVRTASRPETPQMAPFNSGAVTPHQTPHLIPEAELRHPSDEAHFHHLYFFWFFLHHDRPGQLPESLALVNNTQRCLNLPLRQWPPPIWSE